jgi:hypothetical protein
MDKSLQAKVNDLINSKITGRAATNTLVADVIYVITWKNIRNSKGDSGVSSNLNYYTT